MDDFSGFDYSWAGFLDYIRCYHIVEPLWIATGACIFVGTAISVVPQLIRIVRLRSSYGISSFFVLVTSMSQFFVVLNVFCLHAADFTGMMQISLTRTLPRQLTFGNLFILWIFYLPIAVMIFVFFDWKERPKRTLEGIQREWKLTIILSSILFAVSLTTFATFIILGFRFGFASSHVIRYGKVIGTISTFITVCQYLPQFITTCKLKDNGSLSLITLAIQAPGGTMNAIFMMVGNNDDWTTYLSTLSSAIQQWLLLILCAYYKLRQRRQKKKNGQLTAGNDQTNSSISTINDKDLVDSQPYEKIN
ncbi:PQ loop repeat family protein [Tritrichomonas foetus]|uniref:PQ loop repeat family protein n=1 Tax=Tritrichomonas foetus TaxID=1144522 RepID=A0A1J4KJF4_9EUKA|nr:PQ loop repeat family protein [Tritrichomonas foetus]|eukprot:OHT11072.1 PQ loop repeat family protein [Tritrichomonas foetus]